MTVECAMCGNKLVVGTRDSYDCSCGYYYPKYRLDRFAHIRFKLNKRLLERIETNCTVAVEITGKDEDGLYLVTDETKDILRCIQEIAKTSNWVIIVPVFN